MWGEKLPNAEWFNYTRKNVGGYCSLHRPGSWFLQLPKRCVKSNVQKSNSILSGGKGEGSVSIRVHGILFFSQQNFAKRAFVRQPVITTPKIPVRQQTTVRSFFYLLIDGLFSNAVTAQMSDTTVIGEG